MTMQASRSEKNILRKLRDKLSLPLFGFIMKKHWAVTLMCLIIMFLACPVLCLLLLQNTDVLAPVGRIKDDLCSVYGFSNGFWVLMIIGAAVFIACVMTNYLQSKKSAQFYAGLPIGRGKLLAFNYICGLLQYLFTVIFALASLCVVIFLGGYGELVGDVLCSFAKVCLVGALFYFVIYNITFLAGVLCGRTGFTVLLSAFFMLLPVALYAITVWFVSTFIKALYIDYYFTEDLLTNLSPIAKLTGVFMDEGMNLGGVLCWLAIGLILTALIFILNSKRRTERSEMPLNFKWAEPIVKYTVMYICALLFGIALFEAGGRSLVWLFFGIILGSVLSMMLLNVILQKNVKAMFLGRRGLFVFLACVSLFAVLTVCDAFNIAEGTKDTDKAEYMEIQTNYLDVRIKDSEQMQAVIGLFKSGYDDNGAAYTTIVYKSGIFIVAERVYLNASEFLDLIRSFDNTEEILVDSIDFDGIDTMWIENSRYTRHHIKDAQKSADIIKTYIEEFSSVALQDDDRMLFSINFYNHDHYTKMPVYESFIKTVDMLKREFSDLVIDPYYISATVYKNGEPIFYTEDSEQIIEIVDMTDLYYDGYDGAGKYGEEYYADFSLIEVSRSQLEHEYIVISRVDLGNDEVYTDQFGNVYYPVTEKYRYMRKLPEFIK